ncbi:MAG TPA: IS66 family transposase [Candidatus Woesebacteria bacterium]|nr:IS66 family transposase [Candidatus Woesebacteria bacterium]
MNITQDIFRSYLACNYKAYLQSTGTVGKSSEYEQLENELEQQYQQKVQHIFKIIQKEEHIPIYTTYHERISKLDKLLLAFIARESQNSYGKIIHGEQMKVSKILLKKYLSEVATIIQEIQSNTKPVLRLNKHCSICEFREFCKVQAIEKDDLSLLKSIREREIADLHKKGIFTVTQYSYTFRPRKKKKKVKKYSRPHLLELKALAIREKKILVYNKPEIPSTKIQIYLDMEGTAEHMVYLIGLMIVENGKEKTYSFWGNTKNDETFLVRQFLTVCTQYTNCILFHYGTYEKTFLEKIKKKLNYEEQDILDRILDCSINILPVIYNNVYFPTYSNELKDITTYLGFKWSESDASGIQSMVWRKRWEITQDKHFKQNLLQYNLEDCIALKKVVEFLQNINIVSSTPKYDIKMDVIATDDLQQETSYRWGKAQFFFSEFDYINKCAYFTYQRDKVFLRTNKKLQKYTEKKLLPYNTFQIDEIVTLETPTYCPHCYSKKIHKDRKVQKTVIDLQFFPGGLKKWITQYRTHTFKCAHCHKRFTPEPFKKITSKYGHNLISWVVYQIIENGISLGRIRKNLFDMFGLLLSTSVILGFKTYAANYYQPTYQYLIKELMKGTILHSDETKVELTTELGFVWVFTNMDSVVFLYKSSREGDFLKDFLEQFKGILISDFYSAYDSLPCIQQKCLIHLIRDLNHDLFRNPFDLELKELVQNFGILLKPIITTIDTYGLQKKYLSRHTQEVKMFYKQLEKNVYSSDLVEKYQKRLMAYQESLFTFLHYDGVPWNNNNAEHAIKHFATYRRMVDGLLRQKGIEDYLVLLSIYQTCKYRNKSFLQFLLSKEVYSI